LQEAIPTSCGLLDEQLKGGLLAGNIVLVYGEAETGKTTLAIQCAISCARMGHKTIFVDCDGTFSPRRMAQIAANDFEALAPQIILMQPRDFGQQAIVIERLNDFVSEKVGLIIVDTVTSLYRGRLGGDMKITFTLNRQLNCQMASLAQITRTKKVSCLVVSQVRSTVLGENELVQPVATRVLRFWADTNINLKPTASGFIIKATVETRKSKKLPKSMFLKIEERGLGDYRG